MGLEQTETKAVHYRPTIELTRFRNIHQKESCIILGCGPSIQEIAREEIKIKTIGVNYIQKWFIPDYLLILDKIYPGSEEFNLMTKDNKCKYTFSQWGYGGETEWIHFEAILLNRMDIGKALRKNMLFSYATSITTSIALALYMGFSTIGLLGVDFKGHKIMEKRANEINKIYDSIAGYGRSMGIELLNLSKESMLKSFDKISLQEYLDYYGRREIYLSF